MTAKTYRVEFHPLEPYFFGNEKTFLYPGTKNQGIRNQYFIRGEDMPAQTTILGALRYLLLPKKPGSKDFIFDKDAVGDSSFDISKEDQSFGWIKRISPIFLISDKGIVIPAPFDHTEKNKDIYTSYTPFRYAEKRIKTMRGEKLFTPDYDAKVGLTSSFLRLSDKKIITRDDGGQSDEQAEIQERGLFSKTVRTGINRGNEKDGYFKKEYTALNPEYSFAVYVELEKAAIPKDEIAFLGQGRSAFSVHFVKDKENEEKNTIEAIRSLLKPNTVYCASDAFVSPEIYQGTLFAAVKTKTYRAYTTNGGKINKDSKLYNIIAAGSVFVLENQDQIKNFLDNAKHTNTNVVGYNRFITKQ